MWPQTSELFKLGFSIGVVLQLNQIHETFLHGEKSCEMRVGKAEKSFQKFLVEALRSDLPSFPTHVLPLPLPSQMRTLSRSSVLSTWSKSGLAQNWKKGRRSLEK